MQGYLCVLEHPAERTASHRCLGYVIGSHGYCLTLSWRFGLKRSEAAEAPVRRPTWTGDRRCHVQAAVVLAAGCTARQRADLQFLRLRLPAVCSGTLRAQPLHVHLYPPCDHVAVGGLHAAYPSARLLVQMDDLNVRPGEQTPEDSGAAQTHNPFAVNQPAVCVPLGLASWNHTRVQPAAEWSSSQARRT